MFLDATKAFKRVRYCKIFKDLIKRNVSPVVLHLLLDMYTSQTLRIKQKDIVPNDFNVCNGVKQGGVLSPVLFAVCMDGLLRQLKYSGVRFYIGNHLLGANAYVDEIILICPTKKSLAVITRTCKVYSYEFSITFNARKSIFLVFKECVEACTSICMCVNGDNIEKSTVLTILVLEYPQMIMSLYVQVCNCQFLDVF